MEGKEEKDDLVRCDLVMMKLTSRVRFCDKFCDLVQILRYDQVNYQSIKKPRYYSCDYQYHPVNHIT